MGALDGVVSVKADRKTALVTVELAEAADRKALTTKIAAVLEEPESGKVFEIIRADP